MSQKLPNQWPGSRRPPPPPPVPPQRHDRCPTCRRKHTRSTPQNARYWALLHVVSDIIKPGGVSHSADTWHLYFKTRFLGCFDVALPNLKTVTLPHSTADLDVAAFNDYMTQVEAFANERGAFLEDAKWGEVA